MILFFTALTAYFLGCISFSILMSKLFFKKDIRSMGSGNAGATNMARSFGMGAGAATLAGDILKAVLSALIGSWLAGEAGMCLAGAACLLGHCYPLLHSFKGGKGVSVGAVIAFCIDWRVGITAAAAFAITVTLGRKVSLASICAAAAVPIVAVLLKLSPFRITLALFTAVLVIFRHLDNISRLIRGTEPDFRAHRKK